MSAPRRIGGASLIVVIGLLDFHPPHFLFEAANRTGTVGARLLEAGLLIIAVASVVSAVGIYRDRAWGWRLGVAIAALCIALYIAQETVGLPGLPRVWWEPSRIVALTLEALFIYLAVTRPGRSGSL